MKVAGIAGGVGATTVAALLGAEDLDRDVFHADIVVARNDYRCFRALLEAGVRHDQVVLLIVEPDRSLGEADLADVLGRPVRAIAWDAAIARADDAGILDIMATRSAGRRLAEAVGA